MSINNDNINKAFQIERALKRNYLTKGYLDFKQELLNYAETNFSDKIQNFSDTSVGGMLLDFAAIVGDSLSFYMDHQFNELNPDTAVEDKNIQNHIKRAGIKSSPASPSVVEVTFEIIVDLKVDGSIETDQLPKILKGINFKSRSGINFYLLEDIDFNKNDYKIVNTNTNASTPFAKISKKGLAISGQRKTLTIPVADQPFPTIELDDYNITMIEKVTDDFYNEYYEVEFLTQDTVYRSNIVNKSGDKYYEVVPAPYRFVKEDNINTGRTILRFGSGNKDVIMQPSLIQDPTNSALSLYGRDYFPKFSFDPGSLLKTNSLGIAPKGNINVTYSYGGGLSHNIPPRSIYAIDTSNSQLIVFNSNISSEKAEIITATLNVYNETASVGGTNASTFNQLKQQLNNAIKMQNRIVNYQDLLSKIYSMPAPFGKVSKIAMDNDPNNVYAKNLYVLCYDVNQNLILATDILKKNLSNYLNEFRLIGDTFNILDAKIFNIGLNININVNQNADPSLVCNNVKNNLQKYFIEKQFEINQPIVLTEIEKVVLLTAGVARISTNKINFIQQKTGVITVSRLTQNKYPNGLVYSNEIININRQTIGDVLYPTKGGIFEIKYPLEDILIRNVSN